MLERVATDHIEFRHPSFQDFLAASELLKNDQLSHLVRQAHDPLYHDVIIMAVAQDENGGQRSTSLLKSLTMRTAMPTRHRRLLWLLAAAAVTDLAIVDPTTFQYIQENTKDLLPPRSIEEANELSHAGPFIIDMLGELLDRRPWTAAEVAASIRLVCHVGADESVGILRRMLPHGGLDRSIQTSLLYGWTRAANREDYERDVLAGVDFDLSTVQIKEPQQLSICQAVKRIGGLEIGTWCTPGHLERACDTDSVLEISLERCELIESIELCLQWPMLESLNISGTNVSDVSKIDRLTLLKNLFADHCPIEELPSLQSLTTLEILRMKRTQIASVAALSGSQSLYQLDVSETRIRDIGDLFKCVALRYLNLGWTLVTEASALSNLRQLEILEIDGTGIRDIQFVHSLRRLVKFDAHMSDITDLTPMRSLRNLRDLDVSNTRIGSVASLSDCTALRRVNLQSTQVDDIAPLSNLLSLEAINLCGANGIADLRPLCDLPNLRLVCLEETQNDLPGYRELADRVPIESLYKW